MTPERAKRIDSIKIEEFYWAGKMMTYINHHFFKGTFEEAVSKISNKKQIEQNTHTPGGR